MKQISDSSEKNDDKLYFFFREKSLDSGGGASPSVLARVGRVCLVSNIRLHVTRNRRCTGNRSQLSQSINHCLCFMAEWWGWTKVSCEQVDNFSEGQAGVLGDGRWRGGNLLWWIEWVLFSFWIYVAFHSSCETIVPSSGDNMSHSKIFWVISGQIWVKSAQSQPLGYIFKWRFLPNFNTTVIIHILPRFGLK